MDAAIARTIGRETTVKYAWVGLITAYIMFGLFLFSWEHNLLLILFWINDVEYSHYLLASAVGLLVMAHFYGGKTGVDIIIREENIFIAGVKCAFISLLFGIFCGCTLVFITEALLTGDDLLDAIIDYYFKPLFWVTIFGSIPVVIIGSLLGKKILQKSKRHEALNASEQ